MNKRRCIVVVLIMLLNFSNSRAQELPFSKIEESTFTMKGDIIMIGNASIGFNGAYDNIQYSPNDDFDAFTNNGNIVMDYIDVDDDDTTISSSSATLNIPACSAIKYARLYWTGTYFWKRQIYYDAEGEITLEDTGTPAYLTSNGTFTEENTGKLAYSPNRAYGQTDDPINTDDATALALPNPRTQDDENDFRYIKLALPAQPYTDITPTTTVATKVLYDGFRSTVTNSSNTSTTDVPFVAYADITSLLLELEDPSGVYTVANVKTFTGVTDLGGSVAGWTMVVAYENLSEPTRYISSNDGFSTVRSGGEPITYSYTQVPSTPLGPVNAKFGSVVLEGDIANSGDQLGVQSQSNGAFIPFSDPVNPANNFYNSTISNNGVLATDRNPKSENTLGFDIDVFTISNPNNTVIENNQTTVTFQNQATTDTYHTFLNMLAVEVVEPEVNIIANVEDIDGNAFSSGDSVSLGDELVYVITCENIGNDDAVEATLYSTIPENTNYLEGTANLPNGVTVMQDEENNRLVFDIADALLEVGDSPFTIRYKVQVATSCEITNACSDKIKSGITMDYTGALSQEVINGDDGAQESGPCVDPGIINTLFILDFGTCAFDFETSVCNGEAVLTAGDTYESYIWRNSSGTILNPDNPQLQTISVGVGVYTMEGVDDTCRNITETHTVIKLTTSDQNPIIPFADNLFFCSLDDSTIPEIYLCGNESRVLDASSFINASTIEWQRLDSNSCPTNPTQGCTNTDASCDWVTVGTEPVLTFNEAGQTFPTEGEYRISVLFANTCREFFNFNVYQNTLDPSLVKRDIICGEPGFVRVENVPTTGYEFSLDNTNFQTSNEFTGISSPGEVTVYIRQTTASGSPVLCNYEERITILNDCDLSVDAIGKALDATFYPNPTKGPVTISKTMDDITVLDMNGKVVYKTTGASFDIGHLKSGVYFVKLEKESQMGIQRIIKK